MPLKLDPIFPLYLTLSHQSLKLLIHAISIENFKSFQIIIASNRNDM
jgi:hypothetical protein